LDSGEAKNFPGHTTPVNCVAFSPGGKHIVSGGGVVHLSDLEKKPGELKVWDAKAGQVIHSLNGHSHAVCGVAFSPDGKRLVSGGADKTLMVWDVETGQRLIPPLKGHKGCVRCVTISQDGKRIISGSGDSVGGEPGRPWMRELKIWDA